MDSPKLENWATLTGSSTRLTFFNLILVVAVIAYFCICTKMMTRRNWFSLEWSQTMEEFHVSLMILAWGILVVCSMWSRQKINVALRFTMEFQFFCVSLVFGVGQKSQAHTDSFDLYVETSIPTNVLRCNVIWFERVLTSVHQTVRRFAYVKTAFEAA